MFPVSTIVHTPGRRTIICAGSVVEALHAFGRSPTPTASAGCSTTRSRGDTNINRRLELIIGRDHGIHGASVVRPTATTLSGR